MAHWPERGCLESALVPLPCLPSMRHLFPKKHGRWSAWSLGAMVGFGINSGAIGPVLLCLLPLPSALMLNVVSLLSSSGDSSWAWGGGADSGGGELSFVPGERVSSCRFSKDRSCGGSRWCTVLLSTGLIPGLLYVSTPPPALLVTYQLCQLWGSVLPVLPTDCLSSEQLWGHGMECTNHFIIYKAHCTCGDMLLLLP